MVTNLGTGWVLFGVRSSLVPLFVAEALGRSTTWVGIGFLVSALAQALALWPAGRITDQVGRKPVMIAGGLVGTGSVLLLAAWETLPGFFIAMALYGLAAAGLGTAPAAVVGDVVHGRGGTVVAAFQMASDVGAVVGPLVAGMLVDSGSYALAFAVSAVILALGAAMAIRMPETRRVAPSPS